MKLYLLHNFCSWENVDIIVVKVYQTPLVIVSIVHSFSSCYSLVSAHDRNELLSAYLGKVTNPIKRIFISQLKTPI